MTVGELRGRMTNAEYSRWAGFWAFRKTWREAGVNL